MGGPGDKTRYNLNSGGAALGTWRSTVSTMGEAEVPRWAPGFGRGNGYNTFVSAYDEYAREVNARLVEQQQIGDVVTAIMGGIHQRFGVEA